MARIGVRMLAATVAALVLAWQGPGAALGQILPFQPVVGGVAISPEGVISHRAQDSSNQLEQMRKRLKEADAAKSPAELKCISLPKIFAQAKELLAAGKPLPDDVKYLGGLTQIQYVFVYPDQKDLQIAGPAEDYVGGDTLEPVGKATGRPVLQFYDLVVAMRTEGKLQGRDFFGCTIDPPNNARQISDDIAKKDGARPAAEIVAAMVKAMGPQKVTVLGTADNTRLALALVAADYKLKRFTMGLEITPVLGIGNAVDDTRAAGCRFWFEPQYEPLTVTADGNSYGIKGPRLQVKAGAQVFDTAGVTEKAKNFAGLFNKKLPELVKVEPAFAELQNIADLALVAALVRHDGLDQKVGWDASWCLDANACPVPVVPVPKTAETVASVMGNAVACGGVAFSMTPWVAREGRGSAQAGMIPAAPGVPANQSWQTMLKMSVEVVPDNQGTKP